MKLKLWQVDAFTERPFSGNPAAVVPLEEWLPDRAMQAIANENNLSDTAFFVPAGAGRYALRWFTPTVEVDLCGHATLAAAYAIFERIEPGLQEVVFATRKGGVLRVTRENGLLVMDFPARPPSPIAPSRELNAALGKAPEDLLKARDHLAAFKTAADVLALKPDFGALAKLDCWAVIATAPGENGADFVSRFFAPAQGIDEDPVCGSAHSTLIPYWATRLGKTELLAHQVSQRGGVLTCKLLGDRVSLGGHAVLYLEGEITV